jgi:hypothetical protein
MCTRMGEKRLSQQIIHVLVPKLLIIQNTPGYLPGRWTEYPAYIFSSFSSVPSGKCNESRTL